MRFIVRSKGDPFDPYAVKNPIKEEWDTVISIFNNQAPKGVNNVKQTAGIDWCWMIMELKLVETMIQGLWMSICFALFTLVCAT